VTSAHTRLVTVASSSPGLGPLLRALLLAAISLPGNDAMSYEEPAYTVVSHAGAVEYRRYAPHLIAETVVEGGADFDSVGNEGFRRLFRYIAGANTAQAKIAMTAPVSQAASSEKITMTVPVQQTGSPDGSRVAFMLPRQYTAQTAPVPSDPRVRIVAVPGTQIAVLRYSGRWTERNYAEHRDELLRALAEAGIKPTGQPRLARYNSPFTLPILRRNEVLIEVDRMPD
jgi:hypothetical protein